jgi:hypothetical protein
VKLKNWHQFSLPENVFELCVVLVIDADKVSMLADELDAVADEDGGHLNEPSFLKRVI